MPSEYDAIIIGTGIIGGAIGLELAKRGSRTLNVDKLPAAGYGSTSYTCAIIRFHYSTAEGIAMPRECAKGREVKELLRAVKTSPPFSPPENAGVDDGT